MNLQTPSFIVLMCLFGVGCFGNAARPPVAEQSLEKEQQQSQAGRSSRRVIDLPAVRPKPTPTPERIRPDAFRYERDGKSVYIVRRGDTLYSIAWRFELEATGLGRANGINPPYTIFPGQKIRLIVVQAPKAFKPKARAIKPKKILSWQSPTVAMISRGYGKNNKGIDYQLTPPTRIRAAAEGVVVYAGVGIRGYSRLVIIHHAEDYLSAYGFNDTTRLQEGETVKAGGLVADIKTKSPRLATMHFEIRKEGVPVNPLTVIRGK